MSGWDGSFSGSCRHSPAFTLMRDAAEAVIYVGKAKNLRQRLGSYRVANPERMARRTVRLVQQVRRIDYEICECERSALARESNLLRNLKPKFNRAGVWPAPPLFLLWRREAMTLQLTVAEVILPDWNHRGGLRGIKQGLAALLRLLWLIIQPAASLSDMPAGWFQGRLPEILTLKCGETNEEIAAQMERLLAGETAHWIAHAGAIIQATPHGWQQPLLQEDLETVAKMWARPAGRAKKRHKKQNGKFSCQPEGALPRWRVL